MMRFMRKIRKAALAVVIAVVALPVAAAAEAPGEELRGGLERAAVAHRQATRATIGLSVVDLRTRRPIAEIAADKPLIPASNQKLLTSAAAIERLGGEYRFTTAIYRLGDDLVVWGSGDPTLGDPHLAAQADRSIYAQLDEWAAAVAQASDEIPGRLLLGGRWDEPGRHPDWPDNQASRWYAAPVGSLNFHNNCYDVTFVRRGGRIEPHVAPASRYTRLIDQTRPGRHHLWRLVSTDDESRVRITGTASAVSSTPYSVAVNSPAMLLGRVLAERLAMAQVRFDGAIETIESGKFDAGAHEPLATTRTPLLLALARANKRSLNMAAECVFLAAGDGTWKGSAEIVQKTLVEKLGAPAAEITVADGSGLSRNNRVSPAAMTAVLDTMARHKDALVLFRSMAVAGHDGTIDDRMDGELCRGRVLAKTGYIAGVSCLSGYVLDGENRPARAFAIMLNNVRDLGAAKRFQDAVVRQIVESLDAADAASAARQATTEQVSQPAPETR
jgi:D-alanyl-D-alanine carboxypeptidase/D-alanyl-D-alanine-endopeptidase (penicillin-binding protein 4)